ncbi:secreted RxLR effector protein 161-like [Beta vulgaris subsp. vulgaris]|uniref:secreted RxLR effector protein 161-like n=1 Tax=Beta vulgaris subsp. vulgaris TaxID=3555 RepID=UPI002036F87F|nr:secreted RxLR effector protein 161-like [Beta vulgaris subsp. vulgaris]
MGSLIYLTLTRSDIAYAVSVISRFMQKPMKRHLEVVRRILWYVKGTIDYGIQYHNDKEIEVVKYCDADYARDLNTRRPTTSYVFNLGTGAVSWSINRQPTMSLSSTKAEYKATTMATQECVWLTQLLKDLYQPIDRGIKLACDSQSAIRLAENSVFHARTKHVEVHYHFVREKVLRVEIEIEQVNTEDQVADIFTKGLGGPKFEKFRKQLGMTSRLTLRESSR